MYDKLLILDTHKIYFTKTSCANQPASQSVSQLKYQPKSNSTIHSIINIYRLLVSVIVLMLLLTTLTMTTTTTTITTMLMIILIIMIMAVLLMAIAQWFNHPFHTTWRFKRFSHFMRFLLQVIENAFDATNFF